MRGPIVSERRWSFDVGADELWSTVARTDEYPTWWPWLHDFDAGEGFVEGARWYCVVSPPLPYVVRLTIELARVRRTGNSGWAAARVRGDVRGEAVLHVVGAGPGRCRARLSSRLVPAGTALRRLDALARPVSRWGHDRVLDRAGRQFVQLGLVLPRS